MMMMMMLTVMAFESVVESASEKEKEKGFENDYVNFCMNFDWLHPTDCELAVRTRYFTRTILQWKLMMRGLQQRTNEKRKIRWFDDVMNLVVLLGPRTRN